MKYLDTDTLLYYKELYDGHIIIYVLFKDMEFLVRSLTRKEYRFIINNNKNKLDIEDEICNTCCLYPENYHFETSGLAGLNATLSDAILDVSGFKDVDIILGYYNKAKEANSLEIQCMDLIKAFIPEYTYEQMEEWSWKKLMDMTVRAERIAKLKGFEWSLKDESKEYKDNFNKINSDNEDFINELIKIGIDPMLYFADELIPTFRNEVLDLPLITKGLWNSEVVINAVREQIKKKKSKQQ